LGSIPKVLSHVENEAIGKIGVSVAAGAARCFGCRWRGAVLRLPLRGTVPRLPLRGTVFRLPLRGAVFRLPLRGAVFRWVSNSVRGLRARSITEAPKHRNTETPKHRSTEPPKHRNTETPNHFSETK
jgi:hypothetical protein